MNRTELAKALGLSRARLYQLAARGMPTTSLEEAQNWRALNASKRLAVNGVNAGKVVELNHPGKKRQKTASSLDVVFKPSEDAMFDLLRSARMVQEKAREMLFDAMNSETFAAIPSLIANHNKALEAAMEMEECYREEVQRRKLLVPKQAVVEIVRRSMESVLRRLRKLPGEVGPKQAQKDAQQTTAILELEIGKVIRLGEETLAA